MTKTLKGWLAALFLLLAGTPEYLPSQVATSFEPRITGRVLVRGTQVGVSDATILVEGTNLTTRTDSLGRYTLNRVPTGPQVLLVRRLVYAPARTPVTAPPDTTHTLLTISTIPVST